jgi:hypothetical protein
MDSVNFIKPVYNPYKIHYRNLKCDWQLDRFREANLCCPNISLICGDSNLMDLAHLKALEISWKEPTAGTAWTVVWIFAAHKTDGLYLVPSAAVLFVLPKLCCFSRCVQIRWKPQFNPLTPELNPSAQRCLMRFFTGDFASWTLHFVNIRVKNQQIHHLFLFSLLIMYGRSYMCRHYIVIFRERS